MTKPDNEILATLSLGEEVTYPDNYAPGLLQAVPRRLNREELGIVEAQPFVGVDVWHAYELSWLNSKGKPVVALARFSVPASSPNIIESKSLKLYLNSLNQASFESEQTLLSTLKADLNKVAGAKVAIKLFAPSDVASLAATQLTGECLDELDISIDNYELSPEILSVGSAVVEEILYSHLLKSNCLITNQPDWATVIIEYSGKQINRESLLRYLISFRQHNEFHEQCVERIFCDIQTACEPTLLSVQALYTRRGGLDINPFRTSNLEAQAPFRRVNRQ